MNKYDKNAFASAPSCHSGPVEVIKNLFCGGEDEAPAMAAAPIRVDTLVPLLSLNTAVWDSEFCGEILYCPIKDYGTLDNDILDALVSKILDRLSHGKKVGLFCMGGHGRTGYVASVVLGKLGYEDPIQFLRENYCRKAVESNAQIRHIAEILGNPELVEKYEEEGSDFEGLDEWIYYYHRYGFQIDDLLLESEIVTCGDCARFIAGKCQKYKVTVGKDDWICDDFITR